MCNVDEIKLGTIAVFTSTNICNDTSKELIYNVKELMIDAALSPKFEYSQYTQ